ncbi:MULTISPECIES: YheV family putative zinc ribbon protein [Nitrincola]|nr:MULTISPECIES: YheV family putative zinc ribbon protein [Nitrincola]
MSQIKRFIAGAVCPRCGKMDCVRMYRDEEREHRECIECGFADSLRLDGRPEPSELNTRVNGDTKTPASIRSEPEVKAQPIKFFTKPKKAADEGNNRH